MTEKNEDITYKSRVKRSSRDEQKDVEPIDGEANFRLVDEVVESCMGESIPDHDIAVVLMTVSKEFFDRSEFHRDYDEFSELAEIIDETEVSDRDEHD